MAGMDSHGCNDGGKSPSVAGRLGASLFFLFFFGMGSLFELFLVREFGRALGQRFWQKTPCTIVSSEVQERGNGDTPFAFAVSYQFTYARQSRTSSTYKRNYSASSTYTEAQQLARKYPAGLATFCYVNPKAAGAVVLKRDSPAIGFVLFFPLIFVLIGAGGLYFTWRRSPPETEKPIAATALRKNLQGKGRGRYALVGFLALFALVGGGMLYPLGIKPIARTVAAEGWVAAPCRVLRAEVRSHDSDDGTTYSVYILYQYEFGGQTYKCDRYSFVTGSSSGYQGKARIVEQYRTAARPICYVNPRDPTQAVLKRGFHIGLLIVLLPLVFLLVGVGGVIGTLRAANPLKSLNSSIPARQTSEGQAVLVPKFSPRAKFVGMAFFAFIWNGIISVIALGLIGGLVHGHPNWLGLLFVSPFVAIGVVLIGVAAYQFLAIFNPRPTLELNRGTIPLGGTTELRWSFTGRTSRIEEFTVTLRGVEEARYRRGTSTYTDHNTFYELELYRTAEMPEIASGQVGFVLPLNTMHAFKAENNKILWSLEVYGRIRRSPDVRESFPITVTPAAV